MSYKRQKEFLRDLPRGPADNKGKGFGLEKECGMWDRQARRTPVRKLSLIGAAIFSAVLLFSSLPTESQDLDQSIQSLKTFDYQKATDLGKLEEYAKKEAGKFIHQAEVTGKMEAWVKEAREAWVASHGEGYKLPGTFITSPWETSPEYRDYLKKEMTNQMQVKFPAMVDQFMRGSVLQGAEIGADQAAKVQKMIGEVTDQALSNVGGLVSGSIDQWGKAMEVGGGSLEQLLKPAAFLDGIQNDLAKKMGEATKTGMKEFIDNEMIGALGANFEQKLNDLTQGAADTLESIKGKMDAIGNIDLAQIEANLQGILDGAGLPNPFNLSAGDYLGHQFHKLKMVPRAKLPDIEIPSPAMAGIWASSAASHFGRAFKKWGIDWNEIRAGINLIKHLVWQLEKKPRSFMMFGGDFAGRALFGAHGFKGLSPKLKAKLEELIKEAGGLPEDMDPSKVKEKLKGYTDILGDLKVEMDKQIVAMGKGPKEGYEKPDLKDEGKEKDCEADPTQEECKYEEVKVASKENQDGTTDESPNADSDSALDPVILYSGEYALTATDLKLRGRGLDYELTRHYRNQWERMGPFGYNWTHNYDEKLILDQQKKDVVYQTAEGLRYWYRWNEKKQRFAAPRDFSAELIQTEGGYVLRQPGASRHYFNSEGRLSRMEDEHKNALRFEYGLAGQALVLVRVVDTLGRAVEYRYNDEGLITSAIDPFGREVVYTYDAQKDLVSVRSPVSDEYPNGKVTRYAYSGGLLEPRLNHNLVMIMDPKGQIYLKNIYGSEGLEKDKITAQLFGGKESQQMRVEYDVLKASKPTASTALSQTIVWDRKGVKHTYEHNAWGLRLSYQLEKGAPEKFEYNNHGLLTRHVYPGGKEETFSYQGQNLVEQRVKGEDGKEIIVRYGYDPKFNKIAFEELTSGTEVRKKEYTYNDAGLLSEVREGDFKTQYEYDSYGQIVKKIEGEKTRAYTYENADPVLITDSAAEESRSIAIGYDLYGNISEVIDPLGSKTRYWVNVDNLVVQKQDALGNKTHYRYDANNNLVEVTRDVAGALNAADLGYQLRERYSYDVLDNLVKKELQVNREKWVSEEYGYDLNENLTLIKGIDGIALEFAYDKFNRVTEEKIAGETKKRVEYDADGFLTAETDGKGQKKEYQRDSLSRIVKFVDPLGSQLALDYTGFGEIAGYQFKDAKANILKEVRFAYDALGRKVREEERQIGSQDWIGKEFVYQGPFLEEIKDPLGLVQQFSYNPFGEIAKIEDAAGNAIQFNYDPRGLITRRAIAKAGHSLNERYEYDALGQLISQIDPQGAVYKRMYNSLGQLIKEVDPLNQETLYYYDGIGRLLKEVQGTRERKLLWNETGVLEAFVDGQGNKVQYSYDAQGRKKTEIGPDGLRREYSYDEAGNLASLTAGQTKYDYTYDALNRLIERVSGEHRQTYSYDPLGRLVASQDLNNPADPADDISAQFKYDPLGNLAEEVQGGRTLRKRFNLRGQKTALFYSSGEEVTQGFDPAGWLENIQVNGQSVSQYQYALLGFAKQETLGNGITRNFAYDPAMQLIRETYNKDKTTLSEKRYQYDAKGRVILAEDVKQKSWQVFGYNNLDQLDKVGKVNGPKAGTWDQAWALAATKREYSYAAEGQWRSIMEQDGKKKEAKTDIASGPGFQYAQFNGSPLSYDERGNLTSLNHQYLFEYDPFNRLTAVKDKASGRLVAQYTYDAHNRRVRKQVFFENVRMGPFAVKESESADAATDAGPYVRSIEFVYDNWNLIEEYENGQLGNVYIHGKTIDEPVALKSGGKIFYYHRDRLGSVTGISDEHGRMAQRYEYNEYGVLTALGPQPQPKLRPAAAKASDLAPIAPVDNPFTYTGQYFDAETGLYYYKNRYYAPTLGQFTSKDPLGMIDGPNVYAYVTNDPLNWIDPMGTFSLSGHQEMTMQGAQRAGVFNKAAISGMIKGNKWNDLPQGYLGAMGYILPGTQMYEHHKGSKQFLHSMSDDSEKTNQEVLGKILKHAEEFYKNSKCLKIKADKILRGSYLGMSRTRRREISKSFYADSGFYLGSILHMIQDSYSASHTIRNKFGVESFQNYNIQKHSEHKKDDKRWSELAVKASGGLISLWQHNSSWSQVRTFLEAEIYNLQAPNEKPWTAKQYMKPTPTDVFSDIPVYMPILLL